MDFYNAKIHKQIVSVCPDEYKMFQRDLIRTHTLILTLQWRSSTLAWLLPNTWRHRMKTHRCCWSRDSDRGRSLVQFASVAPGSFGLVAHITNGKIRGAGTLELDKDKTAELPPSPPQQQQQPISCTSGDECLVVETSGSVRIILCCNGNGNSQRVDEEAAATLMTDMPMHSPDSSFDAAAGIYTPRNQQEVYVSNALGLQ